MNARLAERLPRLPGDAVRRAGDLLSRLGPVPRRARLQGGRLGDVELELIRFEIPPDVNAAAASRHELFRIAAPSGSAWIAVEPHLATRLAARLLGMPRPRLQRALGAGERGALSALLVSVLRGAGSVALVDLTARHAPGAPPLGLRFRVAVAGEVGVAELWLDHDFRPRSRLPVEEERVATLAVDVHVELARTVVRLEALISSEEGDAVVFEGFEPGELLGRTGVLRIGAQRATVRFIAEGELAIESPFEPEALETSKEECDLMSAAETTRPGNVPELLAAAPVEVVAELGRMTMRGDDVLGLAPGTVLAFSSSGAADVELRVGARPWARGELVDVDGELAVRITSIL